MYFLMSFLYKLFIELPLVIIWTFHLQFCHLLTWLLPRPAISEDWRKATEKTAIVVGGATGIGRQLVKKLVSVGCKVILLDINAVVSEQLVDEYKQTNSEAQVIFVPMDLGKFRSIKQAAREVIQQCTQINVLFLNAGIPSSFTRVVTADGNELLSQINCVGQLAFFERVKRRLIQGRAAIIATGSISHASIVYPRGDDVNYMSQSWPYSGWFAYSHSKLVMALCMKKLSTMYEKRGLVFLVADPKAVVTDLGGSFVDHMFHFVKWERFHTFCHSFHSLVARRPESAAEGFVGLGLVDEARQYSGRSFTDYQTAIRHWSLYCPYMYNRVYASVSGILHRHRMM